MATSLEKIVVRGHLGAKLIEVKEGAIVSSDMANVLNFSLSFTASGTGANQADLVYHETSRALAAGNEDLDVYDLANFAGTDDVIGNAVVFASICAVIVRNQSSSIGSLLVGANGTTAAWNSMFNGDDDAGILVQPSGIFLIGTDGTIDYGVTDVSNHLLRITASGGDCTYDIGILGRSA